MKHLIILTGLSLSLLSCSDNIKTGYQSVQKDSRIKEINLLTNNDASLAYDKTGQHKVKDSGCRNYHKKKYE